MESQPNIRFLKAIVIVLGILIIISAGVVVVGIFNKLGGQQGQGSTSVSTALPPVPPRPVEAPSSFGTRKIELPRGSRVIEVRTEGERMLLRVRNVGGAEQIIVLHLGTGERLGSFEIDSVE